MASIGNLVVNLTAKTDKFRKKMTGAASNIKKVSAESKKAAAASRDFNKALKSLKFGGGVIAVGAAAAGIGMTKLAADAEQLEVKFRVLLKSGDAAKQMMLDIGAFAASTPFQKMDIAEAGQKLLAFNVPANKVMGTLRNIGDISALTGNRIGELAELYGKANVQGRLFGEDINQLTGRGIPIIQELAKQFGVAESEVKGLVEAGDVSARNIEMAFASMTAAGGQFENGMAQLSKTTAGQFSTLKDNITELGASMGQMLLPVANKVLGTITGLVRTTKPWGETIIIVGFAISAASSAIWVIVAAMGAYAKTLVFIKGLSGPKAWAMLAVSLTVATGAAIAVGGALDGIREESQAVAPAAQKAADQVASIAEESTKATSAVKELTKAEKELAVMMQGLQSPVQRVKAEVQKFKDTLIATQQGIVWDNHPLVVAMRQKESGFTSMLSNLQNELKILRGEATETGIKLQQMTDMGVDPAQVEKLRKLFAERDKILAQNRAAEEWRQKVTSDLAERNRKTAATPEKTNEQRFAGVMQQGSAEAFALAVRASTGKQSPVKEQKKTNTILRGMAKVMERQQDRKLKLQEQPAV